MSDFEQRRPATLRREPLAWQAAAEIRARIQGGRWAVGERLPSEPQLAAELGISRGTLREAFRMLLSDGLLRRQHGVGTFVARRPTPTIERSLDELFSLSSAIEQQGYVPSTGSYGVSVELAGTAIAEELRVQPGDPICHLSRVRLADARPVILSDDYLALSLLEERACPVETVGPEVSRQGSLYAWMEDRLGVSIDWALTHLDPIVADDATAAVLGIVPGSALLRLRQTHYSADGAPILYSEDVHNSDVIKFHIVRRRFHGAGSPEGR